MSKEKVKETLEKLYERGRCYDMDIFINSSVMLSACAENQYFEVTKGKDCLVLFLTCNGYSIAAVRETNIDYISVYEREE